jgi:hypothetical protein
MGRGIYCTAHQPRFMYYAIVEEHQQLSKVTLNQLGVLSSVSL